MLLHSWMSSLYLESSYNNITICNSTIYYYKIYSNHKDLALYNNIRPNGPNRNSFFIRIGGMQFRKSLKFSVIINILSFVKCSFQDRYYVHSYSSNKIFRQQSKNKRNMYEYYIWYVFLLLGFVFWYLKKNEV